MIQGCTTSFKTGKNFFSVLFFIVITILCWVPIASNAAQKLHYVFVTVKSGDTLASIFRKNGIPQKNLTQMLKQPIAASPMRHLHIGQHMRFGLDAKNNLESFALSLSGSKTLVVFRGGAKFIARIETAALRGPEAFKTAAPAVKPKPKQQKIIRPPSKQPVKTATVVKKSAPQAQKITTAPNTIQPTTKRAKKPDAFHPYYTNLHYNGLIIRSSLYTDGKKYGIPYQIINQLTKIFALQINFKKVKPGDKLVLAYDDKDIIAVKFTHGTRVYSAVRYVNAQGVVEYFTPDGMSMKRAFDRFPVKYTHINSLFNMHRMHPVTHVYRPHTGVDLAGQLGSPIHSIGDGRITFIGYSGAYGNLIKIQHDAKYSSMYAHMLRFAPGLTKGAYVKRGQLIGYLGQTGNATGPHVHFEVRVNNTPVNPLTVQLPNTSSVSAKQMAAFRIRSKNLMTALDAYQQTKLK